MGLFGRVFDDGLAGQQGGGDHDVDGGAHGGQVQTQTAAVQSAGTGAEGHIFRIFVHLGAQGPEALYVLVDGTVGEGAAAGQRHMGLAEPAQQSAHQIVAGAHLPDQILVGLGALDGAGVDLHHMGLGHVDIGAHSLQNIQKNTHIGDIGDILNAAFSADQKRCGQNGHGGILCAADVDGAIQRMTAVDFIYSQG